MNTQPSDTPATSSSDCFFSGEEVEISSYDCRSINTTEQKIATVNNCDQRVIPFSHIGRKIYVNRADLAAYLPRHRIDKVK